MQRRPTPRPAPAGHRLYFEAGGGWWRQPRPSVCTRLLQAQYAVSLPIMADRLADAGVDLNDRAAVMEALERLAMTADGALALASTEAMTGAALGLCWADPEWELETRPPLLRGSVDSLLIYGDAVLEEIHEADRDIDTAAAGAAVMARVQSAVMPSEQEVEAMVGNGSPAGEPPTS